MDIQSPKQLINRLQTSYVKNFSSISKILISRRTLYHVHSRLFAVLVTTVLCLAILPFFNTSPALSAIPGIAWAVTSFNAKAGLDSRSRTPVDVCLEGARNQSSTYPLSGSTVDRANQIVKSFRDNTGIINVCVDQGNYNVTLITFVASQTAAERDKYFAQLLTYHKGLRGQ